MPLPNNIVTRYPNGVTNTGDLSEFANLRCTDRTIYHFFEEDFDKYTAAQWTVGGVGTPVAPALVSGDGGILSMANSAASGDNNWIQQAQPAFTYVSPRQMFMRVTATLDDATLCLFAAGWQVAVAANNFLTPADGIFLRKPAADTNLYVVARVGGVETLSAALGPLTSGTQFRAGIYVDGQGNIVGSLTGGNKASITPAAITAVALKMTCGFQNGSAVARTGLLDLLWAAKERI